MKIRNNRFVRSSWVAQIYQSSPIFCVGAKGGGKKQLDWLQSLFLLQQLGKWNQLSSSGSAQALRHSQAHSGSNSGSVTQAQWQSDRDSEPGLTLKSCRPPPLPTTHYPLPTPQLLSIKEGSHTKTQRVKLTQDDPLYPTSIKNQMDGERQYMGQSNMF